MLQIAAEHVPLVTHQTERQKRSDNSPVWARCALLQSWGFVQLAHGAEMCKALFML